jgi:hypothetical protein
MGTFESVEEGEEEEEEPTGFAAFFGGGSPPSVEQGSNTFRWQMREEAWTDFEGRIFWAAGPVGPAVLPGDYEVRLTVDGETQSRDFSIEMNPRAVQEGVTLADLRERYEFAVQLRDRVSQANEAVIRIRDLKGQVDERLEDTDNSEIEETGETVQVRLTGVEEEIYQTKSESSQDPLNFPIRLNNKLAALLNQVEAAEDEPTEQMYEVYEVLSDELQVELDQLQLIIQQDIAQLNQLLRQEGLPPIDAERLIS